MSLKSGELFNEQIQKIKDPHKYEGFIYCGCHTYMFCQIGPHVFDFIDIDSGNRLTHEGAKLEVECGANGLWVLTFLNDALEGEILTCQGTINEYLRGLG